MSGWQVATVHAGCATCDACADSAITLSRATGSTGGTHRDGSHGATVTRRVRDAAPEHHGADHLWPPETCAWFALCDRPAVGTYAHPVLGDVPICESCAARVRALEAGNR